MTEDHLEREALGWLADVGYTERTFKEMINDLEGMDKAFFCMLFPDKVLEKLGLSEEEIAFYDALAENQSAVDVMGDDKLKVIAHELLVSLRQNVSVDWAQRDSARARMRVLVKRILRKYGYPPDLQDAAVQTVLQQAEALSSKWARA